MPLVTRVVNAFFSGRLKEIDYFRDHPAEVQQRQLRFLLKNGSGTAFGREHGMRPDWTAEQFRQRIPVYEYETFARYIDRVRQGQQNLLWNEPVKWFAKSSGTTGSKSKFIPVTKQGLKLSHMRGPKDILTLYCSEFPETKVVYGKMLALGGSKKIEREGDKMQSGDLSAILIENTPFYGNWIKFPSKDIALIPDFDEKVRRIAELAVKKDVRSFTGVPSWNLVMMNKILEYTGKENLMEIWPNMELFVHGGMDFRPYEQQYKAIIPSPDMRYMETYNASEGFFGIAEEPGRSDMLLMLDYGTYYEFLPMHDIDDPTKAVPLEGVKRGVNYAMIITTCNGLWRYRIGDTVEFVSTEPYTIRITGRTKHYINAFGEELMIDNAEAAMHKASQATDAVVAEYTVAPVYMHGKTKGAHEWVVEFTKKPTSLEHFTLELDKALKEVNSDYEAKRFKNTTLLEPRVTVVRKGTFMEWMRSQGKMGGQNKVPRLFNDRTYADQLINFRFKKKIFGSKTKVQ